MPKLTILTPNRPAPLQDFKEPGSQSKQYFLGLEAVFGGSGNPAYPGGQVSTARVVWHYQGCFSCAIWSAGMPWGCRAPSL